MKYAGIFPIAKHNGKEYVLLGKEVVANAHGYDHPHNEQPPPALDDLKIPT